MLAISAAVARCPCQLEFPISNCARQGLCRRKVVQHRMTRRAVDERSHDAPAIDNAIRGRINLQQDLMLPPKAHLSEGSRQTKMVDDLPNAGLDAVLP